VTSARDLIDSAQICGREAEQLVLTLLERDRAWLFTHGREPVETESVPIIQQALKRREQGEPIAYIIGSRSFWNLDLAVTPAVLIPRSDTELLVEWGVECIRRADLERCLDLGTGSGAIALAIKAECPACAVTAVDRSGEALAVAQANGESCQLQVAWLKGDWFEGLSGQRWPLIISNPPYVRDEDPHLQRGDLPAEPREALAAGPDGLKDLKHLIAMAPDFLEAEGYLLLEHGWDQAAAVRALLLRAGFKNIETRRDLAGHERVTGGCLDHG